MGKFLLFALLWRLTGNPFLALIIILVVLYVLDRRYVGLFPSVAAPLRRNRRLAKLRQELAANPHQTSARHEAARLLIEKKRYREAAGDLERVLAVMDDSAEAVCELGLCRLKLGAAAEGERLMLQSLAMNPRVKYGEPYLRLGEAFAASDPDKAIGYLKQFGEVHSSSCEAYYRLGKLYKRLGRRNEAAGAFREALQLYRSLPRYKRRSERRWALLSRLQA